MELEKIGILHQYGIHSTEEMELQSHGTQGTNKDGGWRDLIANPDPSTVNVGIDSEPVREWWANHFNIEKSSRHIGTSFCILNIYSVLVVQLERASVF